MTPIWWRKSISSCLGLGCRGRAKTSPPSSARYPPPLDRYLQLRAASAAGPTAERGGRPSRRIPRLIRPGRSIVKFIRFAKTSLAGDLGRMMSLTLSRSTTGEQCAGAYRKKCRGGGGGRRWLAGKKSRGALPTSNCRVYSLTRLCMDAVDNSLRQSTGECVLDSPPIAARAPGRFADGKFPS